MLLQGEARTVIRTECPNAGSTAWVQTEGRDPIVAGCHARSGLAAKDGVEGVDARLPQVRPVPSQDNRVADLQ